MFGESCDPRKRRMFVCWEFSGNDRSSVTWSWIKAGEISSRPQTRVFTPNGGEKSGNIALFQGNLGSFTCGSHCGHLLTMRFFGGGHGSGVVDLKSPGWVKYYFIWPEQVVGWFIWMFFENRGTPKSSILVWFSIINHPFWGTTIFGNTYFYMFRMRCLIVTLRIPTLEWKGNRHRPRDVKKPIKYITVEPIQLMGLALFCGHFQFTRYSHERYKKHIPPVDGSELLYQLRLAVYPIIYKVSKTSKRWCNLAGISLITIKRYHVDPLGVSVVAFSVAGDPGPLVCLERALMDVMFMPVHGTSIPSCHRFLALWRCWLVVVCLVFEVTTPFPPK